MLCMPCVNLFQTAPMESLLSPSTFSFTALAHIPPPGKLMTLNFEHNLSAQLNLKTETPHL